MGDNALDRAPCLDRDFESILLYAMRYALGRCTYAVDDVCSTIERCVHDITSNTLMVMLRDIEEATSYGMEIDEKRWMCLKNKISAEIQKRGKRV